VEAGERGGLVWQRVARHTEAQTAHCEQALRADEEQLAPLGSAAGCWKKFQVQTSSRWPPPLQRGLHSRTLSHTTAR